MHKNKHKINTGDDDVRSQKSHYTNVSKPGSAASKNVELSLEVELDDEVRQIIKNPEKCASALLDVTVVRPKGGVPKRRLLKTAELKELIQSIALDEHDKKELMAKLFGPNRKSCLASTKHVHRQSKMNLDQGDVDCVTFETNQPSKKNYSDSKPEPQHIYTTPRTYENIKSMFACKRNLNENDDNDKQPCLCQNCAIVGILTDSQKRPFATEAMLDPTEDIHMSRFRRPSRKKSVSFKHLEDLPPTITRSHDHCQAIFKLLAARISELERRVIMQEEKAVPKDYFKKIITKLVTHLSKLTHYTTEERNATPNHRPKEQLPTSYSTRRKSNDRYTNRYFVNPILVDNAKKVASEKTFEPTSYPSEKLWKWGEDVVVSGRGLKNKVAQLLEEALQNLKKGWEKSLNNVRTDTDDIQSIVDELSRNLARTVHKRKDNNVPNKRGHLDRRTAKPSLIPRPLKQTGPPVKVAYVNPRLTKWPEESSVSFRMETSDHESHRETLSETMKNQYKKVFLKVLNNTRTTDKFKLWQNVWNQALEHRHCKNDTVTVQIPDPKDPTRQKMIHLDFTIAELEQLLVIDRDSQGAS